MGSTLWSVLCLAGLWGFVTCTIFLILRGFPARDRCDGRALLLWGGGGLAAFAVWILGMMKA